MEIVEKIARMIAVHSGIPAALRFLRVNSKKKQGRIRIVFMCQLPQVWTCMESIYDAAREDKEIEAYILAIPNTWENGNTDTDALDYCRSKGYDIIPAYNQKTKHFYELEKLNPDYVFIPRPYDHYLPEQYRSGQVSRYAKVCYVCYGYSFVDGHIMKTAFNKYFTTNCYFLFSENASVYAYCKKNHLISSMLGIRKIVQTPYPRFDLSEKWIGCEPKHWKLPRNDVKKRIVWTPRWTTDERLGGTNFFNYKDFFFELAEKHPDVEIMIRPHPLAFQNFLKQGLMSEQEIFEYKEHCKNAKNIQLDDREEYFDSFASADILVTDMSGVLVDFLAMDKPVVFCSYMQGFNVANEKLKEGFYIPHNADELGEILESYINGEDPKKEIRQRVTKEVLGEIDGKAGERIIKLIKKDFE